MPAARPSSKSRKSKASNPHSTSESPSKSSSSRPNGTKRIACRAWWCDSTFTRRADMLKHVGLEHFGKRAYCTICCAVMKQDSNMSTHLNAHFGNQCTLCSCGQGFTDPSAYTRHREATGHEKGSTHGKARPTVIKPVKVQHLAGLALNLEMVSNPNFIPPLFDESFHLKGMPKPKAQEKYNPKDYVIIEPRVPNVSSAQTTGILLTDGAPVAEYQEPTAIERRSPAHTEIQMDKLGLNVDFSYDVELPQEPQYSQGVSPNVYPEYHRSSATHPTRHPQPPSDDYYTSPEAIPYPTPIPHMVMDTNFYLQYSENYPMAMNGYFPMPPQPLAEPHAQPECSEIFHPSQMSNPYSVQIPPSSLDVPSHYDFFEEMGFGMPEPEPFQQPQYQQVQSQPPYHPDVHSNHLYQPELIAY